MNKTIPTDNQDTEHLIHAINGKLEQPKQRVIFTIPICTDCYCVEISLLGGTNCPK